MSTETPVSPQGTLNAADAEVVETHRTAAEKFFSPENTSKTVSQEEIKSPQVDTPNTPTLENKAVVFDPLKSVIKTESKNEIQPSVETNDIVIEDIDKGLQAPPENAKSRSGWEELKKRGMEAKQALAEKEKKLADLESKYKSNPPAADEATKARLAELETQVKQYSDKLKVLDLKSHPEFVQKYVQPAEQAKTALKNIAKTDEVDVNVDELLSLKGKALNSAVSESMERMTPYARVRFQATLDNYFATQAGADQALAQADEFLKNAQQSNGAKSRIAFDTVANSYRDTYIPAVIDENASDTDKKMAIEYNAGLSDLTKKAEAYAFGQINEQQVADLAHKAALYEFSMKHAIPRIATLYNGVLAANNAKIAELETQVKSLTGASPKIDGGSGTSSISSEPVQETHRQAAMRYFAR